ncbi:MAG: DNA-processing protein DprA [Solirubrobacteraceae bacterium]
MSRWRACPECLRRAWLLVRLAGHLDVERERLSELLDRADEDLIEAVGGTHTAEVRAEWEAFDPDPYRERCDALAVETLCRCDPAYPAKLWDLEGEPAVLHVAGGLGRFLELTTERSVAIVGARRASPYALENARSLARGLAGAMTVISGMASGADTAAHEGVLHARGRTIAVLASSPERPYPPSGRLLHQEILSTGAVVSELGPGVPVRRWMFPARNRIIAALADMTVLVAGRQGSGAIGTALTADELGRHVGAVPGQVTAPLSFGPHLLLRFGAHLVAEPVDVLKVLFEDPPRLRPPGLDRPGDPSLIGLFEALADGYDPPLAFAEAGLDTERGLAALAELEMGGWVRRQAGGRYCIER